VTKTARSAARVLLTDNEVQPWDPPHDRSPTVRALEDAGDEPLFIASSKGGNAALFQAEVVRKTADVL
jgi:hypothetical protein